MRRYWRLVFAILLGGVLMSGGTIVASYADPGKCGKFSGDCFVKAIKPKTPPRVIQRQGGGSSDGGVGSSNGNSSGSFSGGSSGGDSRRAQEENARATELQIQQQVVEYNVAMTNYGRCLTRQEVGGGGTCSPPTMQQTTGFQNLATAPAGNAAAGPVVPVITPAQAGAMAVARLQLPVNAPGIGPDPDKNEWKIAAVGYPLWLWADGPTQLGPVGESVGGLSVSLRASVSRSVFRMGDGKTVRCSGTGTPYKNWVKPGSKSPDCGYTYTKPSLPGRNYTVTAVTYWEVTWTVNGTSGVIVVPREGTVELPVGELQAVIVR